MSICRPYPPPSGWQTIERIPRAKCTWTCECHGVDQRARDMVAEKVKKAEEKLHFLTQQLAILEKVEETSVKGSVYNYDYQIKGLTRPKYEALGKTLNNNELQEATRKNLKDRQTFLQDPHSLIDSKSNTVFYFDGTKDAKEVRSEYEDTISRDGLEMVKSSQQFR